MHALIIDDSRAMRRILKSIVAPIGFEIDEADNGRTGLAGLLANPDIELVLVDWNMPEMDGLEFVQTVRANPDYRELKIVMVTSETEPAKMAKALMSGVDEFIMKPFTKEILLDKLALIGALPVAY